MAKHQFRSCIIFALSVAPFVSVASAQTIIIDPRPIPPNVPPPRRRPPQRDVNLTVKKHAVDVAIVDGVSTTRVDQVFVNPCDWTVEGTYVFPLDDDVALGKFSMFVDGQEIEGKLLNVEQARREYESIVARMRDPALLEYVGKRMFRARIFPIQPKGEVRIKLSYTQMLRIEDGLVRYRYPLGTERRPGSTVESLSVLVNVESKSPIKDLFSPSHTVAVSRPSEHKATASYEASHLAPERDFELFYTLSDKEFGLTVLTYRQAGEDGFFLARISPPAQARAEDVLPKDISFVIDTSGSMAGEKIQQARNALRFCLANLNEQDHFNVIAFSHEVRPFRDTLVSATAENVEAARKFVDDLQGTGGTNINDALLAALQAATTSDTHRPYIITFLTDGQPTIGVVEPDGILKNIAAKNSGRVRLFVFGVGYDVNTHLLDLLAERNRGAREYVEPDENLELKLSSFYRKVAEPVLADLSLSFGSLSVHDLYPSKLGDLFAGGEVVVAGRYKGEGPQALELRGTRRGTKEHFVYETTFPSEATTHEFLPRLWATRKIGYLLDEIRLHGETKELKDTIVELATKYGIVTPYTAYLVTEPGGVAWQRPGEGNVMRQALRTVNIPDADAEAAATIFGGVNSGQVSGPLGGTVGAARNVRASRDLARFRAAAPGDASMATGTFLAKVESTAENESKKEQLVRHVGTRTFYRVGERWIDAQYDSDTATRKVELFSRTYFELIREHPELARCFALGERVVVVLADVVYESVPPPSE